MSSYTLIIGNKNYSSWSLRPWLWMKQAGLAFQEKRVALYLADSDQQLAPYFSNFKVPVLVDDDLTVWDSLAILEYLADKHPEKNGWPNERRARAVARSVSAEMHSSFIALRNEFPMNCRAQFKGLSLSSEADKDIQRVKAIWKYCKAQYGDEGPWLFGDFCIADAMFAPVSLRFISYNVPLSASEKAYVQAIAQHRFVIDWMESGKREKEFIEAAEIQLG